ncbi:MAG: LysM peptidoglycan-binding domain-containing protein [Planctomycetota bacterium]|nr:LysM peptidoglycan-binding domain-containing protein [Planctomycetota bacterium]
MTRENKLALVVGFGLILLVGILISDHFSAAQTQQAAELTQVADPLDHSRWEDPELIAMGAGRVPGSSRSAQAASLGSNLQYGGDEFDAADVRPIDPAARRMEQPPPAIEMGGAPPARVGLDPAESQALPFRFHDVTSGESLTTICRKYYGDASLLEELAQFNDLSDPNLVRAGRRLRIPDASDLVRGRSPAAASTHRGQTPAREPRTYTVREGDSLSEIAQRLLGSSRFYQAIFESNRDVLRSPDDIRAGMVLKIPRDPG